MSIGQTAETAACTYLQCQGLKLLQRNYRSRLGEIDLVMLDNGALVFVEVRCRKHRLYGGSVESITQNKQHCIKQTALIYLKQNKLFEKQACRFDVIAITMSACDEPLADEHIQWIKDAF